MSNDITSGSEPTGEPVPPKARLLDDARTPEPPAGYEVYPGSPPPMHRNQINTRKSNLLGTILLGVLIAGIIGGLYLIFTS